VLALGARAAAHGQLNPIAVGVLLACVLAGFDALAPLPAAFAAWSRFRAGLDRVAAVLATPPGSRPPRTRRSWSTAST
jgi:ABC-type transport system involved in cytochrome bd biosynthesis fused ATPase/permease subunit